MNFYKHHLGDYAAATSHLSWDEDCAYRRLLDAYYKREAPIPSDFKDAARLARATTPTQRRAVETVLREFFTPHDDGWHQKRCDEEIAEADEQGEDRDARVENERERQRRHRAERRAMFADLRERGIVPPWDSKTETLRALLKAEPVTQPVTSLATHPSQPVTRDDVPPVTRTATAIQTPDSRLQTPEEKEPPATRVPLAAKATRKCPPGFELTPERIAWADANAPGVDARRETDKFRDHTFKTAISDWQGAWRNWLRRALESLPKSRGNGVLSFRERDEKAARESHARWTGRAAPDDPDTVDMEDPHARLAIDR